MSDGRQAAKPEADALKVIADELNQPLFAITANADAISRMLAREAPDLGEVRAALADITSDAQRVSRMIGTLQRLLAAAREPPAHIDVGELVEECVVQMRTEMFAQRVACEVETAPHLPGIRGVRRQLVQMLRRTWSRIRSRPWRPVSQPANGASRCARCSETRAR